MATKKKKVYKVYKDYQDYLNSGEWTKLRKQSHDRVKCKFAQDESECEVCGNSDNLHVHHYKYPKDWNDDKVDYHVVLCKDCHDICHDEDSLIMYVDGETCENRDVFLRGFRLYRDEHFIVTIDELKYSDHLIKETLCDLINKKSIYLKNVFDVENKPSFESFYLSHTEISKYLYDSLKDTITNKLENENNNPF